MILIPNFHVALIHFPIALLLLGVAMEIVCLIGFRTSGARAAARWMILMAAVIGWPALYSGLYAVRTAAGADFESATWADVRANAPKLSDPAIFETLKDHFFLNAGAILTANLVVIVFLMAGTQTRRRLYVPALVLLVLSTLATLSAAWHGGELVYWHDVTHVADAAGAKGSAEREIAREAKSLLPPLDTHATLAGCATGLCLLAWAVASRTRHVTVDVDPSAAQVEAKTADDPQTDRIFAAFQPNQLEAVAEPPRATLGWVAAIVVVLTAFFGIWSLSESFESRSPKVLWDAIVDHDNAVGGISRRLAHLVVGLSLVVLPILVAFVGSKCRKSRAVPLILGVLLLIAVGAQTWIGTLLLLDSNAGSAWKVNE